jgi:sigma-E factor negative regulatory protein RseB
VFTLTSPAARRLTPAARRLTPAARRLTPAARRLTPAAWRLTPGARWLSVPARRRDGWSPLLATAAAVAVAVPGFLISACSSQASAAGSETSTTASQASAESTPSSSRRSDKAKTHSAPSTAARQRATQLLAQAAQAAIGLAYQGDEVTTRWVNGTESVLVSDIWHASGGQTVTQTLDAGTTISNRPYLSADNDGQAPEGVLGVTLPLLQLLESHYVVAYAGSGSADDRTAQVIEAWRSDGSLAARYWLDETTKLPLEREVFDSARQVISRDEFVNVQFADQTAAAQSKAQAAAQGPWTDPLSHAQLLALRASGWQVPAQLPDGLSLFTGAQTTTSTGTVLDLGYSDGLAEVSVFEQHGKLADTLAGWRKTTVAGHAVLVAGTDSRSLTWSSKDMVYTVIADAPAATVNTAVGALPHDKPPGFWKRMSRGMTRLAAMVNPFR